MAAGRQPRAAGGLADLHKSPVKKIIIRQRK